MDFIFNDYSVSDVDYFYKLVKEIAKLKENNKRLLEVLEKLEKVG